MYSVCKYSVCIYYMFVLVNIFLYTTTTTGLGMDKLLTDLLAKAETHGQKIHVMGAANVGKSSFINRLIESANLKNNKNNKKINKNNKNKINKSIAQATVSNLPGTTLDFLRITLPNNIIMIDTPGLLQKGQLTSKLNSDELKQVIPAKEIKPLTLRITEGKCVLLGALARVELLKVCILLCVQFIYYCYCCCYYFCYYYYNYRCYYPYYYRYYYHHYHTNTTIINKTNYISPTYLLPLTLFLPHIYYH